MSPLADIEVAGGSVEADYCDVVRQAEDAFEELRGARIFLTGGTGFVGTWLVETFVRANVALDLGARMTVLTRRPEAFRAKAPHLVADPALRLITGDVTRLTSSIAGERFTHVIHAATEASAAVNDADPLAAVDTAVAGTRAVLECAKDWGSKRVLFTSSGAVYGAQPSELDLMPEDHRGAPDPLEPAAAYAEGKRMAEMLCALYAKQHGVPVTVARLFAFVGPYLPLDFHYAIGNFIADGLGRRPITVAGDGSPVRSYLYAGDMAVWLWSILAFGDTAVAYNVGSEAGYAIADVARTVAEAFDPPAEVAILGAQTRAGSGNRYVPSTQRARDELGLTETVSLTDAVARTVRWYESRRK